MKRNAKTIRSCPSMSLRYSEHPLGANDFRDTGPETDPRKGGIRQDHDAYLQRGERCMAAANCRNPVQTSYLFKPAMASSTAHTAAVSCLSKPCAIAAV